MKDKEGDKDDDREEIDFRDLTRSALERMLAKALRRRKGERDPEAGERADKEREDLADLSEEKKGKSKAPEVKEDDFHPDDLEKVAKGEDDKAEKKTEKPFKKKKV